MSTILFLSSVDNCCVLLPAIWKRIRNNVSMTTCITCAREGKTEVAVCWGYHQQQLCCSALLAVVSCCRWRLSIADSRLCKCCCIIMILFAEATRTINLLKCKLILLSHYVALRQRLCCCEWTLLTKSLPSPLSLCRRCDWDCLGFQCILSTFTLERELGWRL